MALSTKQRSARYRAKHPARSRVANRDGQQRFRDKTGEETDHHRTGNDPPGRSRLARCAEWARDKLIVPPGHPQNAGQAYGRPRLSGQNFFKRCTRTGRRHGFAHLHCVARKNSLRSGWLSRYLIVLGLSWKRGRWRDPVSWRAVHPLGDGSRRARLKLRPGREHRHWRAGLEHIDFWRRSQPAITAPNGSC